MQDILDTFLFLKESALKIYKRYETYFLLAIKFMFSFMIFGAVSDIGGRTVLSRFFITFSLSVIGTVMPLSVFHLMTALSVTLQVFYSSVELSVIVFCFLLVIYLFYARVFPKQTLLIYVMLFAYQLKIPQSVVLFSGLYIGFSAVVPCACGLFIWNLSPLLDELIKAQSGTAFSPFEMPDIFLSLYTTIFNSISPNQIWVMHAVILSMAIIIIRIISAFSVNYSKYIALLSGAVIIIVGFLIVSPSAFGNVFLRTVMSLICVLIMTLFDSVLDYKRAERVQFEDEENYYYVKVIPKILSSSEKAASKNESIRPVEIIDEVIKNPAAGLIDFFSGNKSKSKKRDKLKNERRQNETSEENYASNRLDYLKDTGVNRVDHLELPYVIEKKERQLRRADRRDREQ